MLFIVKKRRSRPTWMAAFTRETQVGTSAAIVDAYAAWIQRPDFRNVGKIRERRSAIQATGIFKVDELAARVTVEDSH